MGRRISFDAWAMNLAEAVAIGADCSRRRIGCVIVDKQRRVVITGHNGSPPGAPGCLSDGACPRARLSVEDQPHGEGNYDNCIAIHAEMNALIYADPLRLSGATIYITAEPCLNCGKAIHGAGIARVVTPATPIAEYRELNGRSPCP